MEDIASTVFKSDVIEMNATAESFSEKVTISSFMDRMFTTLFGADRINFLSKILSSKSVVFCNYPIDSLTKFAIFFSNNILIGLMCLFVAHQSRLQIE